MTYKEATHIVGRTNAQEPFLSNMIRALTLMAWMNTAEDERRLKAARIVRDEKRHNERRQAGRAAQ